MDWIQSIPTLVWIGLAFILIILIVINRRVSRQRSEEVKELEKAFVRPNASSSDEENVDDEAPNPKAGSKRHSENKEPSAEETTDQNKSGESADKNHL